MISAVCVVAAFSLGLGMGWLLHARAIDCVQGCNQIRLQKDNFANSGKSVEELDQSTLNCVKADLDELYGRYWLGFTDIDLARALIFNYGVYEGWKSEELAKYVGAVAAQRLQEPELPIVAKEGGRGPRMKKE